MNSITIRPSKQKVLEFLQSCVEDPMWVNHAEINKRTLEHAIFYLSGTKLINYSVIQTYAWEHQLSYNKLSAMVREATK